MEERTKTNLKVRCYKFSVSIIKFIESLETKRIHYSIMDQLLRSSTSIGANVIEAKSASSRKDFTHYYQIALKSANETKYWLCLTRDGLKVPEDVIKPLLVEADEISKIIAASVLKLKKQL